MYKKVLERESRENLLKPQAELFGFADLLDEVLNECSLVLLEEEILSPSEFKNLVQKSFKKMKKFLAECNLEEI